MSNVKIFNELSQVDLRVMQSLRPPIITNPPCVLLRQLKGEQKENKLQAEWTLKRFIF